MRRTRQATRRKCGRRQWLAHCAYIAKNPRANWFFELVMVSQYGVLIDTKNAWAIATAGMLPRTNFRPTPTRAAGDDLPF